MGTGCQVTLARAIPSPIPDTGPPVLCAPLPPWAPEGLCRCAGVCTCVCVRTGLRGHLCVHTFVCVCLGVCHSRRWILQVLLCLDCSAGAGVAQAWEQLGPWAGVCGGAPAGEEADTELAGRAPQGSLGGDQMPRHWPSMATRPLLSQQSSPSLLL